ncbi:hypothetical protein HCK01_02415 [Streptomyces sp. AA8]|uniref:hypothetical protein n=1 Tax=Streptomyces telluris TaxID=2720021 RepID=UPI00143981C3|nr:hypothetical protein [Streptomyces telluris]NJP76184.1 hypothetical protein [Streptomyces telluris]
MAEGDDGAPMRWDSEARRGAGGWVPASGGSGRAGGTANGGGPVPPGARGSSASRRFVLLAAVGAVTSAVVALVVVKAFFPGSPAGQESSPGRPSASSAAQSAMQSAAQPEGPQSSSPSSEPYATGRAPAAALDALLTKSAADREKVTDAVNAVESCASGAAVAAARSDLNAAAVRRDGLVEDLSRIAVEEIGGGRAAAEELRTAWRRSAEADRAFARWAHDAAGCSPGRVPHGSDYDRGVASSGLATQAKQEFLRRWAPIAVRYGLPVRDHIRI